MIAEFLIFKSPCFVDSSEVGAVVDTFRIIGYRVFFIISQLFLMCLESRMCCFGEIVSLFSFGERLVFPGAGLSDQGTGFSTEFL